MKNPVFIYLSPWGRLLLFVGLILISAILFSFLGLFLGKLYLGISVSQLAMSMSHPSGKVRDFAIFYQFLNQLGIFIFPALLYSYLVAGGFNKYFRLDKKPSAVALTIIFLSVYTVLPFLNYLTEINQNIHLPAAMHGVEEWMRNKEMQAKELTEAFLKTKSISGLVVNLVVMALIPALGEELLFRGVLQRQLISITKNVHRGIILTAFLFSAFHFQFLGFLPRFLLGLMLGYSMVITGSLWSSIWLHFVNNASTVVVFFLHYKGIIKVSADDLGSSPNQVYVWGSLLITLWLFIMLYNKERSDLMFKYPDTE